MGTAAYAVRQAAALSPSLAGSFELVEGKVANVGIHDGRAFLDFRDDYRQGFRPRLRRRTARRFATPVLRSVIWRAAMSVCAV
jgi:hypothetical protein